MRVGGKSCATIPLSIWFLKLKPIEAKQKASTEKNRMASFIPCTENTCGLLRNTLTNILCYNEYGMDWQNTFCFSSVDHLYYKDTKHNKEKECNLTLSGKLSTFFGK